MFTIPLSAKIGLGIASGLVLLGAATPAVEAMTPLASHAAVSPSASPSPGAGSGSTANSDRRADRKQLREDYLQASAQVLGMSPADLRAALKSGKSLSDLATAKGMTKETFADALGKAIKPLLDADVDAHKITAKQAARVEKAIASGHLPLWDRKAKPAA